MKLFYFCLLCTVVTLGFVETASPNKEEKNAPSKEATVDISPDCAAALLVIGAGAGGTILYFLTPAAMCTAGFCATGIAGNSFAAWWQSTMPLVVKGGLFATLQSIAMTGTGGSMTIGVGALGGSALAITYIEDFCAFIDESSEDSALRKTIRASLKGLELAKEIPPQVMDACKSSDTCQHLLKQVSSVATPIKRWMSASKLEARLKKLVIHRKNAEKLIQQLEE